MLNLLPFVFANERLDGLLFNVRLILGVAVVAVTAYQVITNTLWLRENPARQRDRNKAEAYSALSDEMVEIESGILDKVPAVLRQKTQAHIDAIVEGIAKEKADSIIRDMGYGALVDGQNNGPSNADLLNTIRALQTEISLLKRGNGLTADQPIKIYTNGTTAD